MKNPTIQRGLHHSQRIKLLIMFGVFCVLGTLGSVHFAHAAVVCWDGGGAGDTDWDTAANWESDTQPGSGDVATFDSTDPECSGGSPNNNVTINVDPNVLGINITNYTGTITQSSGIAVTLGSSGYAQSASGSTFTGGNSAIDISDGAFTLSNGAFTSTSNTLSIERNFTVTGGTFTHSSGTVTFDGTGSGDDATLACNSITFNSVTINKTNYGADLTVGSDCTLLLGNSPTSTAGLITNNGTITVGTGTWTLNASYTSSSGTLTMGGTVLDMNDRGNTSSQPGHLTLTSGTFPSGLVTLSLQGNLNNSGNLLPNNIDLTLDSTNNGDDATLTCGTATFNSVTINKTNYGANLTVGSDCTLPLGNSPTSTAGLITNNGTITVGTGTWTLNASYTSSSGTLTMGGTVLDMNDRGNLASQPGHLTLTGGSFPSGLVTLSLQGNLNNSGNLLPNNIDLTLDANDTTDDATLTCGTVTFNSVTINKTSYGADLTVGSDCTLPLGNSPTSIAGTITNNGTITVGTGTWTLNASYTSSSGTLTMSGTVLDMNDRGNLASQPGHLTLTGGTFPSGLDTLSLRGNLNNSGNLLPNNIDLTLDGSNSADDATLTCGTATFNSMTINKTSSGANTKLASNCTVTGNFTRIDGPVTNPSSPYILSVEGDFSMSTTRTFGGANMTLELTGTNAQNVTQNDSGTIDGPFNINKTGANAATLTTALTTTVSTCDIVEGIFDIAGNNFTCGSTFTVQDGGSLRLQGGETTVTSPTLATGSTVIYNGTAGPHASLKLGNTYYHLTFDGADSWTMAATTDINGSLTITTGTVVAPATLTVAGNFTNSGTFTHSSGTVTLDGTDQTLSGATTFNNLTKTVTSAATLTLPASTTQTIIGTLTLQGVADNLLSLRSSTPDTQWSIDAQGILDVEYLDIQDSNNTSTAISCTTGCINSGNNTNWVFTLGSPGAPDTTSPEPIEDFRATLQEDGLVLLTWTNSPDTDFFQTRIYRSTNTSFTPSTTNEIARVPGSLSSSSSYIDTGVEPDTTYTYKILTEDTRGNLQSGFFYPSVTVTTRAPIEEEEQEPSTPQEPPITAEQTSIIDGDLITTIDSFDIYIVKLIGTKKFKRLILNPAIFESYAHLRWDEVQTVSQEVQDAFILSQLIIEVHEDGSVADPKVYEVSYSPDSDVGQRQWLNMSAAEFEQAGYDWDAIYHINHTEASSGFYVEGDAKRRG